MSASPIRGAPIHKKRRFVTPREPTDLEHEPDYPGLHTMLISIRDPEWTAHTASKRCPIEEPHMITKCGEFQPVHACGRVLVSGRQAGASLRKQKRLAKAVDERAGIA